MNDNRIAEIQQRCEAATPSPWEVEKYYHDEPYERFIKSAAVVSTYEDGSKRTITRNNWSNPVVADLEFIAHAREDIPYLLAQLAERDKEIERLRKEVASLGYRFPPRRRKEQSMTEIEQAIKYWEKFKQESVDMIAKGKDRNDVLAKQVPMCDIALAALREQAEREKGCEYCRGNVKELVDGDTTIFINHEDKVFYADWSGNDYLDWKHCPMCGRRLEAEHDK